MFSFGWLSECTVLHCTVTIYIVRLILTLYGTDNQGFKNCYIFI